MTTEKYGKINTKRKSKQKTTEFVIFLQFRDMLDIFSYCVYEVKILQNN